MSLSIVACTPSDKKDYIAKVDSICEQNSKTIDEERERLKLSTVQGLETKNYVKALESLNQTVVLSENLLGDLKSVPRPKGIDNNLETFFTSIEAMLENLKEVILSIQEIAKVESDPEEFLRQPKIMAFEARKLSAILALKSNSNAASRAAGSYGFRVCGSE